MGKRNPQVRFVAEVAGQTVRLFSVFEKTDSGLIVTTHLPEAFDLVAGQQKQIRNLKHSVHPSPNDPGNQVHETTLYKDGSHTDRYLFTMALADGRFQPIYRRTVYLPTNADILDPNPRDQIFSLGAYDPNSISLHYAVWFGSRDMLGDVPRYGLYSVEKYEFKTFGLFVAWCFTNSPSPEVGLIVGGSTSRSITDDEARRGRIAGVSEGERPQITHFRIASDFTRLTRGEHLDPPLTPAQYLPLVRFHPRPTW